MDVSEALATILRMLVQFEGMRLRPYLCPAGIPTIGIGATRHLDGRPVQMGDAPITREHALMLARRQVLTEYMPAVRRLCPGIHTQQQLAAITDFAYNLGVGALKSSGLRRAINAGRWDDVPRELAKWVRGGGRVLPGLVRRRAAEAALLGFTK